MFFDKQPDIGLIHECMIIDQTYIIANFAERSTMNRITWKEKADMVIMYPQISLKQIQKLLGVGQPSAIQIRDQALKLAKKNGRWVGDKKVPTDLLLEAVGLDYEYFKKMAKQEYLSSKEQY